MRKHVDFDRTDADFDWAEDYMATILETLAQQPRSQEMSAAAGFREAAKTIRAHLSKHDVLIDMMSIRTIN